MYKYNLLDALAYDCMLSVYSIMIYLLAVLVMK